MNKLLSVVLGALAAGGLAVPSITASATTTSTRPVIRGADVSWPNCPKGEGIPSRRTQGEPMPGRGAQFVIIGVTNGPGFYPNPCLSRELRWVARRHLLLGGYALTTYPSAGQLRHHGHHGPYNGATGRGALRNTGYAEARYNIATMNHVGMSVPMIWVDVEPYPVAPWSPSFARNRAVVDGAMRAYRDAGYTVGLYTNPNGWGQVVGNWLLRSVPTWSTVGSRGATAALLSCSIGPSGGPTWIAQWWVGPRDHDLTCPAAPRRAAIFHKLP